MNMQNIKTQTKIDRSKCKQLQAGVGEVRTYDCYLKVLSLKYEDPQTM